ncbi:MAG: ABC transporter substrate-binding protein, partial [Hyphomicrobium denitrificans]|nr:ABC transporter substrate-binding protein [Hyphomicrobium denitrificans]
MPFGKFSLFAALIFGILACHPALAAPQPSIALHGTARYGDGFTAFSYVNPQAPKGGKLTLGVLGSFENLNPLIVRGVPASGVREFAVESLMARSLDEPFTLYGLLAETIDVADDRKSVTFTLNPAAKFSDRQPVTQDDVIASFELLKTKGRPNHRTYFAKVPKVEKVGERGIRFTFEDADDRELPLILGVMPVFKARAMTPEQFDSSSMTPLIGSGPYTVSRVDAGRSLTYARDADYWGKD